MQWLFSCLLAFVLLDADMQHMHCQVAHQHALCHMLVLSL